MGAPKGKLLVCTPVQVADRLVAARGAAAADALVQQLEREWQQLMAMRRRYASAPSPQVDAWWNACHACCCTCSKTKNKRAEAGPEHHCCAVLLQGAPGAFNTQATPPRSILKRRPPHMQISTGSLQALLPPAAAGGGPKRDGSSSEANGSELRVLSAVGV